MALDLKPLLTEQLGWYWDAMLLPRLDGLSDDEHLWEPADGCWSVRESAGRWVADRVTPAPVPPPVTTIAWRIAHLIEVLGCRASYHFGDRSFDPSDVLTGTAAGDVAALEDAYRRWADGVAGLDADGLERLSEGPPNTLDAQFPFAAVILHINREVIHHGAELGVLRDLYRDRPR